MLIRKPLYLIFFTLIAHIPTVYAQPVLDIEVYGLHQGSTRLIHNGDTLFSGDSFQVSVTSTTQQNLFVFLMDTKGTLSQLTPSASEPHSIASNKVFHYPSKNHWYKLDDSTGRETLYFFTGDRRTCGKARVHELTKDNLQAFIDSKDCNANILFFNHISSELSKLNIKEVRGLNKTDTQEEAAILKKYGEVNKQASESLQDYSQVTSRIPYDSLINTSPTTRGIKEVHLFKEISPSVVLITTVDGGIGSGSLINDKGEILTNWHVVQNHKKVGVVFKPMTRRKLKKTDLVIAEVLQIDEVSDLALIKVKKIPDSVKPIAFGDTQNINIGEDVHAIGHPKGENWSYTRGYISSLRNDYEWKYDGTRQHKVGLIIQTQTPINPGNSGGPLLSGDGKLLGVNSFTMDGQGLNYAVSIDDVKTFLKRKQNRTAPKQKTREELLSEKLGYKVISSGSIDVDENGIDDFVVDIDSDKNGKRDTRIVRDGKNGQLFIFDDLNENGSPERIRFSSDVEGDNFDRAILDLDEDGEFDIMASDDDGDGEFDRFTPMK